MRLYVILRVVGQVLLLNALFLLISSGIAFFDNKEALFPLLYSSALAASFGVFTLIFTKPRKEITNIEGLVIVISSWLISCLVGAIPYILWGGEFNFTNAWFESVSGFTTTGSSILTDIESLPQGLLFWRAMTHWIGGVGIIVFVIAILPYMGYSGMVLYRSEVSRYTTDSLQVRTKMATRVLVTVYVGLTLAETLLLTVSGMSLIDAFTHSCATIATGGFSTKNLSIAYFDNALIEFIIVIFMVISGVHFGLLYFAFTGRKKELLGNSIFRYYIAMLAIGIIFVTYNIYSSNGIPLSSSIRQALFQVVSIGTSTGFATADTNVWPPFAQAFLIFLTLQCACGGSTSGGIKADRIFLFFKAVYRNIKLTLHPNAIIPINLNNKRVEPSALEFAVLYIALYLAMVFLSTIVLTLLNVDLLSSFSASAAAAGNVGPGFGLVSSLSNYSSIPGIGKIMLTFIMLLGRVEIIGLLIFMNPSTWSKVK